jgi:maleylacetoacetate isomerase
MQLYTYYRSSTAYRVRIALNLKSLPYEPTYISLPKMQHRDAAYLDVNPQGLVPAITIGGRTVAQSLAIIELLDELHPEPRLIPSDPWQRAYVRSLSQIIACDIHPLNNVRVLKYLEMAIGADAERRQAWYEHWIAEGLAAFEAELGGSRYAGRFCCGDAPTMADVCLVPQVFNARRFRCPLDPYPRLMRIYEACAALPAVQAAHPGRQADAPEDQRVDLR